MNKFQAMAQIMTILNEDGLLKPGSPVYKLVREQVSDRIDRLGPEAAVLNVIDRKPQIMDQIKVLIQWHERGKLKPIIDF